MRPRFGLHRQVVHEHPLGTKHQLPPFLLLPGCQAYPARRPTHPPYASTRQSIPQIRRNRVTEYSAFAVTDRRYPTTDFMSAVYPRRLDRPRKCAGPRTPRAVVHRILSRARTELRDIHYRCPVEDVFAPVRNWECAREAPGVTAAQSNTPRRTHFCPRPAANRAYSSSHRSAETPRSHDAIFAFIHNPPIQLKIRLDYCAKFSYIVNHIRCKLCG